MKSREGTVVDADGLMNELRDLALTEIQKRNPELDKKIRGKNGRTNSERSLEVFLAIDVTNQIHLV